MTAEAIQLVRRWLAESAQVPQDKPARRLAGVLRDPNGLPFTVGFVDGVIRPEDPRVAARNLAALAPLVPGFLPRPLRALLRVGAVAAPRAPWLVIPVARAALRRMVRHLVVDATDRRLGRAIRHLKGRDASVRLNVNLLGEAVLGQREAARRREGTRRLLLRDDVDYVSVKVSAIVAPHAEWAFDDAVADAADALAPLFRTAAAGPGPPKFINLDMEEHRDLDLTLAVFTSLLDRDEFLGLQAGVVLQAYLPDALAAMARLQAWASARRRRGGAPIKVRIVKGANLPMERVDAEVHGWPLATWPTKQASDAAYKALVEYALRPQHVDAVRVGIAGHNLFDVALAWLLARRRAVTAAVDVEMLLGMASAQAEVVRREVGSLLLYTPVVHPREFDVAIAYLVRRLEEGASPENFMSAVVDLAEDEGLFRRERDRFCAAVADLAHVATPASRAQERTGPPSTFAAVGFANTPDTDPSLAANREWARAIQARMERSALGAATVAADTITDAGALRARIDDAVRAGAAWRALGAEGRGHILRRAAEILERRRADLVEVMGSECGKVVEQGDPEVSEAIDFARYYAARGLELERVDGARFSAPRLTVVTPPWNFPVAIPAGSTLAALAAGSPVILKPAREARRCGAVLAEALWEAGVPRDVLQCVHVEEGELGRELVGHPDVERVILTGGYETAERFRSFRADLPLLAETSGKNAIIVTPSADLDLAARDVASSAFGHAGQKCSAASLVVLVGSVASSKRFRRQLVDAVSSRRVGPPWDPPSQVGPLIGPADGKLRRALTTLEPGQRWVVAPEQLDDDGALWRPGIRDGVQAGSEFHLTEYFGPVLGIMHAETLDDAIDLVNRIDYGLTSGLQSLDPAEIDRWLERTEAGNLYVNRHITGAIVQRQPFGGWKKAAVGPGAKAGGPNYLMSLGRWRDAAPRRADGPAVDDALAEDALRAARGAGADEQAASWLAAALATDAVAWAQELGLTRDATGLICERNLLRYRPTAVVVRAERTTPVELIRVVAAGLRAGASVAVSTPTGLPPAVADHLAAAGIPAHVETPTRWAAHARRLARDGGRVRLLGGSAEELARAVDGDPALSVYSGDVVAAGRVELLTFLREQAISITQHRFGSPRRLPLPGVDA